MAAVIKVTPDGDGLERCQEFIVSSLNLQGHVASEAMIIADEIMSNIINYGFDGSEKKDIEVSTDSTGGTAIITFADEGIAFNPLLRDDPDVTASAEDRKIGGLGIFLVRKLSEGISYERKDGRNILTVKKSTAP